jgi:hypothetical protein
MIGFDKTITLYNKRFDSATKQTTWLKTVITGVSWSGQQKVITGDGLSTNDGYSVRIPQGNMPDGFLDRSAYVALADPSGHWTAQNGDVVVLGESEDVINGITEITKRYTECFTVTAVHTANIHRLLPHLRIEGK